MTTDDEIVWDGDFVLDRDFRFVSVTKTIMPGSGPLVGRSIWDAFGGEQVFRAPYEAVFGTGEPARFRSYFDGYVVETLAELAGRYLRIRFRILVVVDVTTLDRLLSSMELVNRALAEPFGTPLSDTGPAFGSPGLRIV